MAKKTPTTPTERLDDLRAQLATNAAELERVEKLPRTIEEGLARARATLDHAEQAAPLNVGGLVAPGDAGPMRLEALFAPAPRVRPEVHQARLLAAFGRDRLEAMIEASLRAHLAGVQTLSELDRTARLAELRAERYDLELEEEHLVRELEEAGEDVVRRADANPEIVLGLAADAA